MSEPVRRAFSSRAPLPRAAWIGFLAFVVAELAVSGRYGFHRDELYFIACAHHLAWGYVDQPPLAPLLVRVSLLFGDTPTVLRVCPALAGGGVVVIGVLFARELGGGGFAQAFTALTVAGMPVLLGAAHLAGTTAYDMLAWSGALLLVTRAIVQERPRLWVWAGAVAGVGLLNKLTIATFLVPGLVVAIALTPQRRLFATPWPWIAGLIAMMIASPTLVWQATHGWPELDMMRSLHTQHSAASDAVKFLPAQLLYADPVLAPLWISGVYRLLKAEELQRFRFLGWLYLVLLVDVQIVAPGRPYYISALYPPLFAAGAWQLETRLLSRGRRSSPGWIRLSVIGTIICGLIALPLLPMRFWHIVAPDTVNYDQGEQIGWQHMVGQIATAYNAIGGGQVAIFTSNYGEAGAIDRYGGRFGLPPAVSGHNAFGSWGPPSSPSSGVLLVGDYLANWRSWCASLTTVGQLSNTQDVSNDEEGEPLTVCRGFGANWARIWPALKHDD